MATGHPIDVLVLSLSNFQGGKKKKVKKPQTVGKKKPNTQKTELKKDVPIK